jgi:trk system potassium uptake protein TrkH
VRGAGLLEDQFHVLASNQHEDPDQDGNVRLVTAATASIATLSSVGPGLAAVGPLGDFSFFEPWQKLVMVVLMWLGRLEFFAVLALVQPQFWRR